MKDLSGFGPLAVSHGHDNEYSSCTKRSAFSDCVSSRSCTLCWIKQCNQKVAYSR